jgi:hypothetical protein
MEDRLPGHQAAPVRQVDGLAGQFGPHVLGHGMTDDLPVEQVDHGRQVQPALLRGQVGDVPDQPVPGRRRGEVPPEATRSSSTPTLGWP